MRPVEPPAKTMVAHTKSPAPQADIRRCVLLGQSASAAKKKIQMIRHCSLRFSRGTGKSLAPTMVRCNNFAYHNRCSQFVEVIMTLRQLELLRALVLHRTTVAAAQDLGLSQPAVSNALKTMEAQAGFALFERVNNRLHPTPEGMTLFRESEAIFYLHARLEGRLRDLRESRSGQLRIVATPPVAAGIIPAALKQLLHTRPRLQVFFDVRRFEGVVEAVLNNVAELGLVLGFSGQPGLGSEILQAGEMVCVFPPGHPLGALSQITPADLVAFPLIGLERGTRLGDALRRSFQSVDVVCHPTVEVRYCNTACTLVASGVGVAIVDPFSAHQGNHQQLDIRPFRPVTPVKAHALWSEARPLSRTCQTFIREVRRTAASDRIITV